MERNLCQIKSNQMEIKQERSLDSRVVLRVGPPAAEPSRDQVSAVFNPRATSHSYGINLVVPARANQQLSV